MSTATRTCAYARVASASGATCSSVGLQGSGRALLGHSIKRPGDLTVIRGRRATLADARGTDVIRRLRVVVVTPANFVIVRAEFESIRSYNVLMICRVLLIY